MKVSDIDVERLPEGVTAAEMAVLMAAASMPNASLDEAARATGLTPREVLDTVFSLRAKGYLQYDDTMH